MKIRPVIRLLAFATLAALIIATVPWLLGAALAANGDAPVVPPPTPDALMAYVQAYGWLVGGLTVAYLAAKWLLKKNESTHWIAQGRALAVVTTVVGVAGTALQAWASGTPWSGVLVTALLGLLHLADAQVTPGPVAVAKQGVAGMLVVLLLGGTTVEQTGCAASARETTIRAGLIAVDSARDGFLAYDRTHEMSLTAHCDPATEIRDQCAAKVAASAAALATYQAKRAKIDPLFTSAYRFLAAAKILDDDPSIAGVQAAIAQLLGALSPFLGGK